MSPPVGRKIQTLIDRIRGKQRQVGPADAWGVSTHDVRRLVQATGRLEAIFYSHQGRVAQKWHHYLEIYERHFESLRQRRDPLRILELGVSRGGSLEIW